MSSLLTRRRMLGGLALSGFGAALGAGAAEWPVGSAFARPMQGLEILLAPNASSIVLLRLMQGEAFAAAAPGASARIWRDTDDLRAAIISGRTRLFTTPTHVPANLANRGLPLKLLAILSMGHLSVVTADEGIATLHDLAGKEVLGFFRNDMPDLVFRSIARGAGMDPEKDIRLTYVQTPMEAAQMMASGRAATAVLSEPPAAMAIMMAAKDGRKLRRAIDLQAAWRAQHNGLGLPMAGIAVHESLIEESPEIMAVLRTGLAPARDWVLQDRPAAADLAQAKMEIRAPAFLAALDHFNVVAESARSLKPGLVAFYEAILALQPEALAGRLPADGFYLDL